MPDAGEIKAKVTIEYDGSGAEAAKKDLASLADIGGSAGDTTASASDGFAKLDEQLAKTADSAKTLSTAMGTVEKPISSGEEAVSGMTEALSKQQEVIDTLQEPLQNYSKHTQSMGEAWGVAGRNFQVFQEAYNAVDSSGMYNASDSMQMVYDHLDKTGQSIEQFTSSIGSSNAQLFHEMSTDWAQMNASTDAVSSGFVAAGKSGSEGFNAISASASDANKAVHEFLGTGEEVSKAAGFGETFSGALSGVGEAFGGIMNGLNSIAMPIMAVQMIGMAVGQVAQGIYDAAVIAEGPAAHSFGTFTGSVDALGQSMAKSGAQFSESFGRQIMPTLDALNYQSSQGGGGSAGGPLGWITGALFNLSEITTWLNPMGGLQGLANMGASAIGLPEPYQGPPPEQQAQINYQRSFASMPQTVSTLALQSQTQADQYLQMASDPQYLASQDQLMAAQQAYQHAQATYNSRHYISPQTALMNYQEQQYDTQQNALYNQQSQNLSPYDPLGYWGGVFGGMGAGIGGFFANRGPSQSTTNLTGPPSTPFDGLFNNVGGLFGGIGNMFSGFNMSIPLGPASMFSGIGDFFGNLFGGASAPITSTGGGCFPAGTRVLLANGDEKPIETLQIGEQVQSHDGTKQVQATITDCITFAAKQTYKLVFSDGNVLFTTDSHPLASLQGWKSISPASTAVENPGLPVTTLEVGDMIYTVDGSFCRLLSLQKHEITTVYNITVSTAHTYYANNVLVHNAKLGAMSNSGEGSENVSLSHTFTATVNWAATGLEKQFTAAAQWAEQNLVHTATAAAQWAEENLIHTATAAAQWAEQNLTHSATAAAEWAEQNLIHPAIAAAQWAEQGLVHEAIATATWAEQGLEHLFTGKASWIGEDLNHMFTAVAQWTAQNLTPSFTVNPSVTMLAEGTSNFAGGPAIVAEAGYPEVVEHNGQYSLFQGATLLDLPAGANVYPMKNLSSSSVAQFADGTDGPTIPLTFGARSGDSAPSSMNIYLNIDGQTFWSSTGLSLAQNVRASSGFRGF